MQSLAWAIFGYFISPILMLFFFGVIAYVILSWLMVSGVIDRRNPVPIQIYNFLGQVIEPIARPIRRVVPPLGQFDTSIIIILLTIPFLREYLFPTLIRMIPL